ncbi:PIG-L deacetylase family protein [Antarcticimicrobium sediminis]|uniref:Uncharacterized protein n=1 Tax=Antarcticimicrobium sediminis TaxID=2546227 RepID=A0A4R5ESV7_9RHOB|nr:PIG-L family deacetylase [Antarcticimicrobium sediminis]TDE37854.1 hypothetical protein E1B25_10520 [Antarcticimicrobium sediminis]
MTLAAPLDAAANAPLRALADITGNHHVLLLLARPEDAALACAGFIAESCARGRSAFVLVMTDGSSSPAGSSECPPDSLAQMRERETRAALALLGQPHEKILMAGIIDGSIPDTGPRFETLVTSVDMIMWARDCHAICAPGADWDSPAHQKVRALAAAVAGRTDLPLLGYGAPENALSAPDEGRLGIAAHRAAKAAAIVAMESQLGAITDVAAPLTPADVTTATALPYEVILPG